jgi:hypothetical protein
VSVSYRTISALRIVCTIHVSKSPKKRFTVCQFASYDKNTGLAVGRLDMLASDIKWFSWSGLGTEAL